MKILVINAGSSSIKYQLIDMKGEKLLAKGLVERIGEANFSKMIHKTNGQENIKTQPIENHAQGMKLVLSTLIDKETGVIKDLSEISAIGHRVLHGGEKYTSAVLVNKEVKKDIEKNSSLGPLHMPANLLGIKACEEVMPKTKNVAVFDTAFHSTMPDYVYIYATPYNWYKDFRIRKYGFHGTSHEYIANETAKALKKNLKDLKIISCHLGNGGSICAIKNGKCFDTSMGFTPLEGIMMGTRSGDIDPAVLEYVMNKTNMSIGEIINVLNKKSGFLGLSGVSNDIRDVVKSAQEGNKRAKLAIEKYVYVIKRYIGAYVASMNGVDAISFSGGIGENRYDIREKIIKDFDFLNLKFDFKANKNFIRGQNFKISKDDSKVSVYIIPTDEEISIARQTKKVVENKKRK